MKRAQQKDFEFKTDIPKLVYGHLPPPFVFSLLYYHYLSYLDKATDKVARINFRGKGFHRREVRR